jgi:phosphoribosylformylglycinamidine synthase PurS subunit
MSRRSCRRQRSNGHSNLDDQLKHVESDLRSCLPGHAGRCCPVDRRNRLRARVFVTLKPSVFDPQGTTVAEALHTLGYNAVKDVRRASISSSTSTRARLTRRNDSRERAGGQAARQSGHRELPQSRSTADEVRGRRLSRIQLRP